MKYCNLARLLNSPQTQLKLYENIPCVSQSINR